VAQLRVEVQIRFLWEFDRARRATLPHSLCSSSQTLSRCRIAASPGDLGAADALGVSGRP
jgi:hypothetical protein